MSDETLHPDPGTADETLASLYVDDQLSAAERAQVESSPATMALVQGFAAQRDRLADVPPAPDAARESAVAAALAQFTMVAPPPNVVSIDRRRRTRWLTAAAAVMLLGVGGVTVAGLMSNGSDDTVSTMQGKGERSTPAEPESSDMVEVAGGVNGDTIFSDTTAGNGGASPTLGSIDGPVTAVPAISSEAELRSVSATATPAPPSFQLECTLEDGQEVLAEITWKGTPALVVRDTVSGVITALDPQCTVLATVAP